jgi:hypothetical protein
MNLSPLHDWYPKDWRAMIALIASIVGGAVLTIFAWHVVSILDAYGNRLITELVRDPNVKVSVGNVLTTVISTLAWGLKLLLAGLITVILSLGFAVNRRSFKINRGGIDMSGGDGEDPPPTPVTVVNSADAPVPTADVAPAAPVTAAPAASEALPEYAR